MSMSRRAFLWASSSSVAALGFGLAGVKIGVTDWNLGLAGKVEAVELAKRLGFAGVEVSLGRLVVDNRLPLDDTAKIDAYLKAFNVHDFRPAGTCLDVFHVNGLKNDPLAEKWLDDGIRLTKQLRAKVMLLPFFGQRALQTREEMDRVGDILREHAPAAEKAGILLGLEDTISAQDNVRIMERARSKAVRVYYDIGNSSQNGFDVAREVDWLGKGRICQMHLKDNPHYLGEGKIDLPRVMRVVSQIGFEGFANLETVSPSKSIEADMKRNLAHVRKVIGEVR
jgi:L-ribulose-5-phosphate 3-epimerase